ncbi:ATP-binding protein [Candidatus Magnetomoraceae bacterium gMMP-13]
MKKATTLQELLSVFKPLSKHDFDKFYVPASDDRNTALRLADWLIANKNSPQNILITAQRGSGKSTELCMLKRHLMPEFKSIIISVSDDIDITGLNYIDLILCILGRLLDKIKNKNIRIDPAVLDKLYFYFQNDKLIEFLRFEKIEAGSEAGTKLGFLRAIIASVRGVMSTGRYTKRYVRKFVEPKFNQLILITDELIKIISNYYKKNNRTLILIIDDLDRLDLLSLKGLFPNHKQILTKLSSHIIYTGPAFLHYFYKFNQIKSSFSHHERLNMINVHNKNGSPNAQGIKIIKKIVEKRADLNLFEPKALDFIIKKSGGCVNDVFEMIQEAALSSMRKNSDIDKNISMIEAESAFKKFKNELEITFLRKHIQTLKKLNNDRDQMSLLIDKDFMKLIHLNAIIEYNSEGWWCDFHPAVTKERRSAP